MAALSKPLFPLAARRLVHEIDAATVSSQYEVRPIVTPLYCFHLSG